MIPRQLRPAASCTPGGVESTGGWDTGQCDAALAQTGGLCIIYDSAAITSSGELYTWGCGECGRLGHGDNVTQLRPKQVGYV